MDNSRKFPTRYTKDKGFALIVTLSLMILLMVIAVGLFQLSAGQDQRITGPANLASTQYPAA